MVTRHGRVRVVAGVELEAHRRDRPPPGEIDRDVHPLPGVEEHALDLPRHIQQAAVGAEQAERNQAVAVAKLEQEPARVARVQDLQACPSGRDHALRVGIETAQAILADVRRRHAGAYLMPSFGRFEVVAEVLEVLNGIRP